MVPGTHQVLRALIPPNEGQQRTCDGGGGSRGGGPSPELLAPTTPLPALGFGWSRSGSRPAGHNAVEGRSNSFVLPKASQLIKFLFPRGPTLPTPNAPGNFYCHVRVRAPCAFHKVFFAISYEQREPENEAKVKRNVFTMVSTARKALRVCCNVGTSRAGWQPRRCRLPSPGTPSWAPALPPRRKRTPLSTNYPIFIATHINTKRQYIFLVFFQIKSGAEYQGWGEWVRIQVSQGQEYLIYEKIS